MPRITRVYTRTGDDGTTGLGGGQRVPKDSARVEAYGTVDELNSAIGEALASGLDELLAKNLRRRGRRGRRRLRPAARMRRARAEDDRGETSEQERPQAFSAHGVPSRGFYTRLFQRTSGTPLRKFSKRAMTKSASESRFR